MLDWSYWILFYNPRQLKLAQQVFTGNTICLLIIIIGLLVIIIGWLIIIIGLLVIIIGWLIINIGWLRVRIHLMLRPVAKSRLGSVCRLRLGSVCRLRLGSAAQYMFAWNSKFVPERTSKETRNSSCCTIALNKNIYIKTGKIDNETICVFSKKIAWFTGHLFPEGPDVVDLRVDNTNSLSS